MRTHTLILGLIGIGGMGCLPSPKVPQTYYDIQRVVQQQATYLHEHPCVEKGHIGSGTGTTPAYGQSQSAAPRSLAQWTAALEMLKQLDLNHAYAIGGYQIDTLYMTPLRHMRYHPKPNFEAKITELTIEEDSSTQELRSIYGKWTEKKYLYHLSYQLKAIFNQQQLQTYHIRGFEKIGWYDTLWYEWTLDCRDVTTDLIPHKNIR